MSTINEAAILRFYLDTQEYSDRLTAIEAQAASNLTTQHTEVAAAIAQIAAHVFEKRYLFSYRFLLFFLC